MTRFYASDATGNDISRFEILDPSISRSYKSEIGDLVAVLNRGAKTAV
ncbi:MAG: hypothetical protein WBA89_23580 [Microcoleus sp.]